MTLPDLCRDASELLARLYILIWSDEAAAVESSGGCTRMAFKKIDHRNSGIAHAEDLGRYLTQAHINCGFTELAKVDREQEPDQELASRPNAALPGWKTPATTSKIPYEIIKFINVRFKFFF